MIRPIWIAGVAVLFNSLALAEEPAWLVEARAHEGTLEAVQEIHSEDGWFTAKVPFKVLSKMVKESDSYSVNFNFGSGNEANCEVFPEPIDAANFIDSTAKATFSTVVEKTQGKVEKKVIEQTDVGVIQHSPYVSVRWLYRVNDGKDARLGGLEQLIARKEGHIIYCSHLDIGYVRTFHTAVSALIESLVFHDKANPLTPVYSETSVVRVGTTPIGYSQTTLERDADSDLKMVSRTVVLIQRVPGELLPQDNVRVEWTHADGELLNATHAISSNHQTDADLALDYDKDHWRVHGEFKGKKLDETIPDAKLVASWAVQINQRRTLLKAEKASPHEAVSHGWTTLDPTHFVEQRILYLPDAAVGQPNFRETLGPVTADSTVDPATGQTLKAVIPVASQSMTLERIDAQGSY